MKLRKRLFGILSVAVLAFTGCDELARVGGLGDYGSLGSDLIGEVEYVDTRAREIEIRTDSGGTAVVRYDDQTQVIYQQRNYSVANLEPGDYIAARVEQGRDGRNYTSTITVREGVQDRGNRRGNARLDRIGGAHQQVGERPGTDQLRE